MNTKQPETRRRRITRWERRLQKLVARYETLDAACDRAMAAGAMDANGALFDAIWRAFETAVELIDVAGWIHWYLHDNDAGKKALKASAGGARKLRPVRTCRDLARLIVDSENDL